MDHGGERMPVLEFVVPDGQEDQAHAVNRHAEPDRAGAHDKEGQGAPEREEERPAVFIAAGPSFFLKEHQQLVKPKLLKLRGHSFPVRLAGAVRVLIRAGPCGSLRADIPDEGDD
jgi:hypothetical protein